MSLTTEILANRPMGVFLRAHFPDTRNVLASAREKIDKRSRPTPIREGIPKTLVGTALDYRIRLYFPHNGRFGGVCYMGAAIACGYAHIQNDDGTWWKADPEFPVEFLNDKPVKMGVVTDDPTELRCRLSRELLDDFFEELETFLERLQPLNRRLDKDDEDRLLLFCVVMAALDVFARNGDDPKSILLCPAPKETLDDLLFVSEESWIDDLRDLSWDFFDNYHSLLSKPAFLNPTFSGSASVGGADADLIVDGCLIDIKTVADPFRNPNWMYQLLGYTLLDLTNEYQITHVGVYFSRQCCLAKWDVNEFMALLAGPGRSYDLAEIRQVCQIYLADPDGNHHYLERTVDHNPAISLLTDKTPGRHDTKEKKPQKWKVATVYTGLHMPGWHGNWAQTCLHGTRETCDLHYHAMLLKRMLSKPGEFRWFAYGGADGWLKYILDDEGCQKFLDEHLWKFQVIGGDQPSALHFTNGHKSVWLMDSAKILPPKLMQWVNGLEVKATAALENGEVIDGVNIAYYEAVRDVVVGLHKAVNEYRQIIHKCLQMEANEDPLLMLVSHVVHAPFSQEAAQSLNDFQQCGCFPPMLCPETHDGDRILRPSADGLRCPVCNFRIGWAYSSMTNGDWRLAAGEIRDMYSRLSPTA